MWKKVVLSILLVISVATGFFAAKARVTIEGRLNKVNRDYDTDLSSVDLSNIHVETDSKVINILLLGDDYRTYDGSTSPGLNDVIMIGTLDMKHNTLKLTSIMRDTLVDVYGQNKKMKVNAAGKKEFGGLKNLYKTLAENFNVKVDGYAEVGFKGFEQAVNAVGGVEVELSDTEVEYLNRTNYVWKKKNRKFKVGKQHLNGAQALGWCRIRKGMDVIGKPVKTVTGLADDYGRTWRQRTVITALFDKMKSQPLSKWMEVADKVLENVRTDLDNDTILKYMKDAVMMGTTQIHQMQIPVNGYYRNDKNNEFPDAQGWSLVPTNGITTDYDRTANSEALRQFIFKYDGKDEFKYKPKDTSTVSSTGKDYDE